MTTVTNLEALLAKGPDNALLRYSLGNEYLKLGDLEKAIDHLAAATRLDPRYSAAWKLHGKALQASGRPRRRLPSWIRASPLPRRGATSRPPRRWASFASGP
jgi:predicted Zn-dependent protease